MLREHSGNRQVSAVHQPALRSGFLTKYLAQMDGSNGDGGYTVEYSSNGVTAQYATIAAP